MKNATKSQAKINRRLENYNAFQKEREKLPRALQTWTGKKRKKKGRRPGRACGLHQDLTGKPATPKPTAFEDALAAFLDRHGVAYRRQFCVRLRRYAGPGIPKFAFLDFYVPSLFLAIEVDGYVHRGAEARMQDSARRLSVQRAYPGVKQFYRLWNGEVSNENGPAMDLLLKKLGVERVPSLIDALLMDCEAGGERI